MIIKTRKGSIHLDDITIMIMIIITLSFHNYTIMLIVSQLLCFIIMFFSRLKNKLLKKNEVIYILWFLIFTLWGAMSILWATHSTTNVIITARSLLQELMTGTTIVMYANTQEKINKIYKYIFIASILLVFRLLFGVPSSAWGTERVGKYIGYGANGASLVLSYTSLLSFHLFQENRNKKHLILTVIYTVFSLLCGSKKAMLIALIGITALLILKSKNIIQIVKRTIIALFIVFILYYLVMNVKMLYNALGVRIDRMFLALNNQNGGDMSTKDRMLFINSAFKVFIAHPITGVGLDNYRFYNYMNYYAHNNYLEIAADLGIIGFVMYYIMPFTLLIKSIIKFNRNNRNLIFVLIFILIVLIMDVAAVSFESDHIQLFIAVIYCLYCKSIVNKTINQLH